MHLIRAVDTPRRKRSFLKFLQITSLVSFNFLLGTSQALDFSALKPYGGLEYVQRSLAFKEGYGKGDFNKRLPQANVFLGIQVNDYLGVEAGYLFSQAVTRTSFVAGPNQSLGEMLSLGQYGIFENKINLTGPQMSFVGRLPFGISGFFALGSVGISWLSLKATRKTLGHDALPIFNQEEVMESKCNFSSKKVIPKAAFGLGYQFTDCIGVRILMGYEKTSRFKNIVPKEKDTLKMTLKDNILCSIGLTVKF